MVSFDENDVFVPQRQAMVRDDLAGRDITDDAVLEVMGRIPREFFVSGQYTHQAYTDYPLPIGMGQTISQPYIVALMTQTLKITGQSRVLEVGTGSGYQTAILASLAQRVYTIERFNELCEIAQAVLGRLNINNVEYYIGDGSKGWPETVQFDRIIITAAVPKVPQPLADQLKEDGIIVAPVGGKFCQDLTVYTKKQGKLQPSMVCGCRFVKLIGEYGFDED